MITDNMQIKEEINVFIVDDNKIFIQLLKSVIEVGFQDDNMRIHLFETGEQCTLKLKDAKPELVILDYYLNSKSRNAPNGLEILDKIKMNCEDTYVIMLTSNDDIDIALKSFHHGASDYVIKNDKQFENIKESMTKIFERRSLDIQNRKKAKVELSSIQIQKNLAEQSKFFVEEKNKNITDSINYAKRIQLAKLPRKEDIYASFSQSFVLYKPKDIVSGDFYFFYKNNESVFIVAADCTGHGVPGAFMSMIGSEKLSDALANSNDTSEILKHLNRGIKNSLHQSDSNESTRDGMDIAICSIDLKTRIVKYAGANRPFWFIRNGQSQIEEIKGTKKSIGGLTDDNQHFDTHEVKLDEGDTFYIASDGYSDQFGGKNGKKLMTRLFKEILCNIQHKSMPEQEQHLNSFLDNWKGGAEQVDDILVIGIRL
ncbi:MAG TPA: SpoIIE family protein phosphatase [Bacteroidia bacterium]|jgi:serine phosphatase RsbU (regulator of sigma subunit)|nr:SpoIIE family protein phosphatase [Bacteroidia bacterium]